MELEIFYPEKAYPDLYHDVMLHRLFPDSKTFADASPLISPVELNSLYLHIDRSAPDQVREFVHHWFLLPQEITETLVFEKISIEQHISSLWNVLVREPDEIKNQSSLIPLPFRYIVPGGRFREIYYWDSYFTMLGLRESGRTDIIREMVNNFACQLDHFGYIPNGNRSYFLSRSQPPFFSQMINLLAEIQGPEIFSIYLPQLILEYNFWMDGSEEASSEFRRFIRTESFSLNRYYDDINAPRAESWLEDVNLQQKNPSSTSLFQHLRAACESGWDFSSRWLTNENDLGSICTLDFIAIDLNCLLYSLEKTIEKAFCINGQAEGAENFRLSAERRAEFIRRYLWDETVEIFSDLNYRTQKFGIPSLALMFPLYAGIATQQQAARCIEYITNHFLSPGGWTTTNNATGQQWDAPNGWAPLQLITFFALKNYNASALALEGAERWLTLNQNVFKRTGRMMEKYNVDDLSLEAGGGEYPVQDGFGWTNGVYLTLLKEVKLLAKNLTA